MNDHGEYTHEKMAIREREYVLYCDESVRSGAYYSNFYGGVLIGATHLEAVRSRLQVVKLNQNLLREVKWQKVTAAYWEKYASLVDAFFDEVTAGHVKVRIMFRQNARKPVNLTSVHVEQSYYILYYQFIKHAFGFAAMPRHEGSVSLRAYFDQFPDTGEQVARFRGFILGLNESKPFRNARLSIRESDLTEVRSHDHVILQCLDVVLGAMAFRLNDLHKVRPEGQRQRGSRTIAKEKLYNRIRERIIRLKPNFNIGITTGGSREDRWSQPYRHWAFVPSEHEYDASRTKPKPRRE